MSDYYNYNQPTAVDFARDVRAWGWRRRCEKRRMWNRMRMSPTDLSDVGGHTYTYLMNGAAPAGNWTGLFRRGEKVRLRFINGSAMSIFDVRIPGLKMTVVAADGQDVEPVTVDEFRIAAAETYDVIVEPGGDRAYTVFAQSIDRTGYARGTLAPRLGMEAAVPAVDAPRWLTMADMMGAMASRAWGATCRARDHGATGAGRGGRRGMPDTGHSHGGAWTTARHDAAAAHGAAHATRAPKARHARTEYGPGVDMRVDMPRTNLDDPGIGLRDNGRRVLTYADLHTIGGPIDPRGAGREIELHLTGHMERYMWSFDGQKFSDARPLHLRYGERLRVVLVERHHDAAPHPPARHVERTGKRPTASSRCASTRHGAAGAARQLPRHRRCAGPLGLPLPPALSHGSRHVPRGGGVMSANPTSAAARGARREAPSSFRPRGVLAAALLALPAAAWAQAGPGHDVHQRHDMAATPQAPASAPGGKPARPQPAAAVPPAARHGDRAAPQGTDAAPAPGTDHAGPAAPHGTAAVATPVTGPGEPPRAYPGPRLGIDPPAPRGGEGGMAMDMDMDMGAMQGGSPPPGARDPDAYADGLVHGPRPGMDMADDDPYGKLLVDRLEVQRARGGDSAQVLDAQAWWGRDIDKAWFKLDGGRSGGRLGATRAEALWNRAVAPFWGVQAGLRHDFGGGPGRDWAALGVHGLAPYWFELQATAYAGPSGRTALRLEAEYDLLLTQRLILQPLVKAALYGRDDRERGIGAGLSGVEAGLRLRYEFAREFAPYLGVSWHGSYGGTAGLARAAGEPVRQTRWVAGVRLWF